VKPLDIAPVTKMSLEAQITIALRDSIINGAIAPGSRITEMQIAEQLDLSRATVRTAFLQLAKEGLLTLVPYSGWSVVSLTVKDAWELYTLRSAVERLAAMLVAGSADTDRTPLEEAYADLVAECRRGDVAGVSDADYALHKTIVGLADHARLATQYGLIEQQIRMYIRSSNALIVDLANVIGQHEPIVDAILSGDAEAAGRLSEEHNRSEGEKLIAHIRGLGDEPAGG